LTAAGPTKGLRGEQLVADELVLASSVANPPGDLPRGAIGGETPGIFPVSQLAGHPLILPPVVGGTQSIVHKAFASVGMEPTVVAEIQAPIDIARAVHEGIGSTITAWAAVQDLPFKL